MIKIDKYVSMGFHSWQIEEIKLAIKNGISEELIQKYMENVDLDSYQLEQVRLGLQDGLDVSLYARKDIPHAEMEQIRLRQLEEKLKVEEEESKKRKEILKQEKKETRKGKLESFKTILVILLILILLGALGGIGYLFRDSILKSLEILELDIPTDVIELNYGDDFNAEDYVLKATDGEDIIKIYPTYFNTNELGEFELDYVLTNNVKTKKRTLRVRVVDKIAPKLELTDNEISLTRTVDEFKAKDYIESLTDNYDSEPTLDISELDWSKYKQEITYKATDSSGNETNKVLTVYIKDKPKPVVQPTNNTANTNTTQNQQSDYSSNNDNNNSGSSSSGSSQQPSYTPDPTPTPQPQPTPTPAPAPTPSAYISAPSVSVKVGTDIGDIQAMIVGGIDSSSGYSVDFSAVNSSAPGSYVVYVYGNDGASTTCTVTVTE